jgi:hypothetical protein
MEEKKNDHFLGNYFIIKQFNIHQALQATNFLPEATEKL